MNKNKTKNEIFKDTIQKNIERKSSFIDKVYLNDGVPLFSWIDLNPTELCNRKCEFCPRVDESEYPNQNLNIDLKLCQKIHDELISINYKGGIVLSGYGEPMLHPELMKMVKILGEDIILEIVTNGDTLTSKAINNLYANNVNKLLISMYDGKHQIEKFNKMIAKADVPEDFVILRDRWYTSSKDFGLKLTNRTGTINIGEQEEKSKKK